MKLIIYNFYETSECTRGCQYLGRISEFNRLKVDKQLIDKPRNKFLYIICKSLVC